MNCPLPPPANITFQLLPPFTSAIIISQQSLLPLGSSCYILLRNAESSKEYGGVVERAEGNQ